MKQIYLDAITKWGIEGQRWALVEEMGEVMQALSHEKRGRVDMTKVTNELIDLQVTLNSVKLHYCSGYEWDMKMGLAEERLRNKLLRGDQYDHYKTKLKR